MSSHIVAIYDCYCILFRFRDKFERLINRGNEKNASDREKHVGSAVARVRSFPKAKECFQFSNT